MAKAAENGGTAVRRTKTLAWRDTDEAVLRSLRAQVAATFGVVWSERDVVAASLRAALSNPASLGPVRPAA
jgi:hypothetical protein